MASACLLARLPPSAFGVTDPAEIALIGNQMIELLQEEASKAEMRRQLAKLNG